MDNVAESIVPSGKRRIRDVYLGPSIPFTVGITEPKDLDYGTGGVGRVHKEHVVRETSYGSVRNELVNSEVFEDGVPVAIRILGHGVLENHCLENLVLSLVDMISQLKGNVLFILTTTILKISFVVHHCGKRL